MESITYRKKLEAGANDVFFPLMLLFTVLYLVPETLRLFAPELAFPQLPRTADVALSIAFLLAFFLCLVHLIWRFLAVDRAPADNFLRLDGAGLIYSIRGRERTWRWSELSGVERRRRSIAVTLPDDDRSSDLVRWWDRLASKGPRLLIRDDYVIPLDDLAAKLDRHLAAATPAGPGRIAIHQRHAPVELVGLPAYMAVWLVPLLMVALVLFFREPGVPEDALLLLMAFGFLALLVGSLVGLAVFLTGKRRNFLSFDETGLRYTRRGFSLAWPWHELSSFEVRNTPPESWPGRGPTARVIAFTARGDAQAPPVGFEKLFRAAEPDSYAILDHYGTSLDDIAAKLNAYRERALGNGAQRDLPGA